MNGRLDIKPLSVNQAFKGQRFKTDEYKRFERDLLFLLPKGTLPGAPYKIDYEFGFSSPLADLDNPVKLTQDILSKKYGFNDKDVHEIYVRKTLVKKGKEYIQFSILPLTKIIEK